VPFKARKRKKPVQVFLLILFCSLIPLPGQTATLLQVVLRDSRQVVWERPISTEDQFFLVHRNSIYESLVREAFLIDAEGSIWLNKIKTSSPAVLEYYGLEDSSSDWVRLSRKIGRIPILITSLGEVHLEWGKEKLFLSALMPEGTLIEIRTHKLP
jgi:hypothetical protein